MSQYEKSNWNPRGIGTFVGATYVSGVFKLIPVETEAVKFLEKTCLQVNAKLALRSTFALTVVLSSTL